MPTKKSVADLDFEFNDFGDLELSGFGEDDVFDEEEELLEDEEVIEEDEEVEEEEVEETVSLKSKVEGLERTMQALPQMISSAIASALSGNKQQKQEDEDEDIPDELDNKQMVNILAKRMQKAVQAEVKSSIKEMKDTDPDLRDAKVTAEFQRCNAKYGQKFRDRMIPVAKIVQRSNYGISVEDAFLSIADMPVASKQRGIQTTKTKPKAARRVEVDADSDDAVGDVGQNNPRPKMNMKKLKEITDADMFQHSWNTSLMSHARAGRRRRA